MHCGKETIHIQKADTNEVSAMAEVLHLEPTTTYSVSIAAKTDHGTYGPPLKTMQLFKTLASPPNKPAISKTSVTSTGNVVVSQPFSRGFLRDFFGESKRPLAGNLSKAIFKPVLGLFLGQVKAKLGPNLCKFGQFCPS